MTHDAAYQEVLARIWENMASKKLFVTGGIGSRPQGEGFGPNYELNNMTAYCETCAAIANVYWNYRMFLYSGDAKYADVYERALYNGVISGVSLSGDRFFYDNPLESMGQHNREAWFGCACCPGNITRFMASVPNYMYASQGKDIYVNLYIQGKADIHADGNNVSIEQATDYPWDGNVSLIVNPKGSKEFTLKLRIPEWVQERPVPTDLYTYTVPAKPYTVKVNGETVETASLDKGYLNIHRKWKKGDKVELNLPMEVRTIRANDNAVDDRGKLAYERGPVIFCLEGQDQPDKSVFDKYIQENTPIKAEYDAALLGGVVTLTGKAKAVMLNGDIKETTFKAIPYSTYGTTVEGTTWQFGFRNHPCTPARLRHRPSPAVLIA